MKASAAVFDALADLFTYPGWVSGERRVEAVSIIGEAFPDAGEQLAQFEAGIAGLDAGQKEELFTRTFDNTDDRSLEIGWQLFGENYARGALMVRVRGLLREHGVPETSELPDHMTHILRLLGRAPEPLAHAVIQGQVLQAVDKLLEGCKGFETPYVAVIQATRLVLDRSVTPASETVSP